MILDLTHSSLGWPKRKDILRPPGSGPGVYRRLASEKLGRPLERLVDTGNVHVGVLAADPRADATEAPIAIVCEFNRQVSQETLKETHRLAWSFCRSPLLITLEPNAIRSWSCCEPPRHDDLFRRFGAEILEAKIDLEHDPSLASQAALALGWLDLVSGEFYRRYADRFQRNQCADQLLLENLRYVREKLKAQGLDYDACHDLLARLIFIQFLFDRKDSAGKPALGPQKLARLFTDGVLSQEHTSLAEILGDRRDAYNFFRWLNEVFNGDLFPGKGTTAKERESEWQAEMKLVKPKHLDTLAQFVSGDMRMKDGQLSLWREYSFDTIPLEFISSVYEEFVSKSGESTGAHYTPAYVVDFMLDKVLPWDSDQWDLKVLDPACGSGIFLVKAYQRLIHRWKNANPGEEPRARVLKQLLTHNLFGVDKDPHAVRVASFSLYLAMCDEIDPRHYWTQVQFPRLRDERLIAADFFREDKPGFQTREHSGNYDVVVGNAPWGRKTETISAKRWKSKYGWTTTYGSIGPLFLPKAAYLAKRGARVAMLQPAGLIFHTSGPAKKLREKIFSEFKVEEVVNLSALRFGLFKGAVSPACVIMIRAVDPDGEPFVYVSPKPTRTNEDDYRVIIEPHDVHFIRPDEAARDRHIWTALMWGGRRDLELIRRLSRQGSFAKLKKQKKAKVREGIIRGDRKKRQQVIVGRRILEKVDQFPKGTFFRVRAAKLPINTDPFTDGKASTDFSAFELPQLIVKQSWKTDRARFQAAITESSARIGGVLCDQKYVSVSMPQEFYPHLEAAWLSYNSIFAVYYLFLTSYRLGTYRPEPLVNELLNVPLPEPRPDMLAGLTSFEDVDERVRKLFTFKPAEWTLIKDLVQFTFADFKGDQSSPGRRKTKRGAEADLKAYVRSFAGVMKAGFGADKKVCATVFQETSGQHLPVRLVAIHLGWPDADKFRLAPIAQGKLRSRLQELNEKFLATPQGREGGIFYQRVARVYDTVEHRGVKVPTVYLIKPDRLRYWTGSMGMRDADEVAAELMSWQEGSDSQPSVRVENRIG